MPEVEAESGLVKMFGESPVVKVVDTLMDYPGYEYTKKELAEVNNISRPTLYKIWDRLEELGIVGQRLEEALEEHFDKKVHVTCRSMRTVKRLVKTG